MAMSGFNASFALELLACVGLWYSSSAIANTSSRKLLTQTPLPVVLTLSQFCCASTLGFVSLRVLKLKPLKPLPPAAEVVFKRLTVVYTIGFLFVNAGYVMVNVSLAETLRSAEPLVTVLLALTFLKESEPVSRLELLSMAPIVVGGALSSFGDSSFSLLGLFFVCVSNLSFSLRSMYTKQLRQVYDGDPFNVFYNVSTRGAVYLTALLCAVEGAGIVLDWLEVIASGQEVETLTTTRRNAHLISGNQESLLNGEMLALAMLNGVTYVIYNQTSFYVLSRVRMVTHGVLNAFRRVVTIIFSVWYFGNEINTINGFGITLAVGGVILYGKAKDIKK